MSKHQVTHSCGHTVEHQLFGPHRERDRRIERMQLENCRDCVNKALIDHAKTAHPDLPKLTGSDKQVAWAERIRAAATTKLDDLQAMIDSRRDQDPDTAAKADVAIAAALADTSASAWIDSRDERYDSYWLARALGLA